MARSAFPHGFINWVAASIDGWVYYVDQSHRQSDSKPSVLWRVIALELSTGKKRVLASNGDKPDPFVPIVKSQEGYAVWTSAESDRTARASLWKPGWPAPRAVLRHAEMTPGSESISGGAMVYLGRAATGAAGHTIGGDCWSVALSGGQPRALTRTALALGCISDSGWLVWSEHIGPKDPVPPGDGVLDDPFELWATKVGGKPFLLNRGYIPLTSPYVGQRLVVWIDSKGNRVIQSLDQPKVKRVIPSAGVLQSAAGNGQVLVFTNRDGDRETAETLTVAPTVH